jgi:hypothetical protein
VHPQAWLPQLLSHTAKPDLFRPRHRRHLPTTTHLPVLSGWKLENMYVTFVQCWEQGAPQPVV